MTRFFRARKDENHDDIVRTFKQLHCGVAELIRTGIPGFPDLVVGCGGLHFVEVKNPATAYGKKGLNKNQLDFARHWSGYEVHAVSTSEDVVRLVNQWRASACKKP